MLERRSYYKEQANLKMDKRYKETISFLVVSTAIIGCLIYLIISLNIEMQSGSGYYVTRFALPLSTLLNMIFIVVFSAFKSSRMSVYVDVVDGEEIKLLERLKLGFVYGLARAIVLILVRGFFIILWTFLLIIPGLIKVYAYSMAMYLTYRKPGLGGVEAITVSKRLTKGFKKEIVLLDLSYAGWYLLGFLTLGVMWFFIVPKHLSARVLLFDDILKNAESLSN